MDDYPQSFKGLLKQKDQKIQELSEILNKVEKINSEFDASVKKINDVLEIEKSIISEYGYESEQHQEFKNSDEFLQAQTEYAKAQLNLQKQAIYMYLSGDINSTAKGMRALKNRWNILKNGSSVSITLSSSKIELKTPQGTNSWATHTHTGNLGAPTTPPIPGS